MLKQRLPRAGREPRDEPRCGRRRGHRRPPPPPRRPAVGRRHQLHLGGRRGARAARRRSTRSTSCSRPPSTDARCTARGVRATTAARCRGYRAGTITTPRSRLVALRSRFPEYVEAVTSPIGRGIARTGLTPNWLTTFGHRPDLRRGVGGRQRARRSLGGWILVAGGLMDTFDGAVARATGRSTPFGGFYDSVSDRISDGVILAGRGLVGRGPTAPVPPGRHRARRRRGDLLRPCQGRVDRPGLQRRHPRARRAGRAADVRARASTAGCSNRSCGCSPSARSVTVVQRIHHVWCQIDRDLPEEIVALTLQDRAWSRAFKAAARRFYGERNFDGALDDGRSTPAGDAAPGRARRTSDGHTRTWHAADADLDRAARARRPTGRRPARESVAVRQAASLDDLPPPPPETLGQRAVYWQYRSVWEAAARLPDRLARRVPARIGAQWYRFASDTAARPGPSQPRSRDPRSPRRRANSTASSATPTSPTPATGSTASGCTPWTGTRSSRHPPPRGSTTSTRSATPGEGGIFATGHLGSWDVGAFFTSQRRWGMVVVAEVVEPRRLFERFVELRRAAGIDVIPLVRGGDMLDRLEARVTDEGALATLLADRDLTRKGPIVEFFGEPCRLPPGTAALARRTGRPGLHRRVPHPRRRVPRRGARAHRGGRPRRLRRHPGGRDRARDAHRALPRPVARVRAQLAGRPGTGPPGGRRVAARRGLARSRPRGVGRAARRPNGRTA